MLRSSTIDVNFAWNVSEAGYEWRLSTSSKAILCERNAPDPRSWEYQPLLEYPALFHQFAKLAGMDEIRRFADQYGVLFNPLERSAHVREGGKYHSVRNVFGTTLNIWAQEIADISFLIDLWDSIETCRINKLRNMIWWNKRGRVEYQVVTSMRSSWGILRVDGGYPFQEGEILKPARFVLREEVNKRLSDSREFHGISYEPSLLRVKDGNLHLFVRPRNLLSAIWLQFAQVVGGSYELKQCPICQRQFLPKRGDAITCMESCRQRKSRRNRRANQ